MTYTKVSRLIPKIWQFMVVRVLFEQFAGTLMTVLGNMEFFTQNQSIFCLVRNIPLWYVLLLSVFIWRAVKSSLASVLSFVVCSDRISDAAEVLCELEYVDFEADLVIGKTWFYSCCLEMLVELGEIKIESSATYAYCVKENLLLMKLNISMLDWHFQVKVTFLAWVLA